MSFELGTDGPSVIVVGVDGSPTSLRAAAYAVGQARRQRARLVVVYVREPVPPLVALSATSGGDGLAVAYELQDDQETDLRTSFAQLVAQRGVSHRFVVRTGDPFREMTAVATELSADAVIVGASTSIGHRLAGSLAVRLVRAGKWPVTVVP
jgi:nucleotide-binding universal stress UspA family protein